MDPDAALDKLRSLSQEVQKQDLGGDAAQMAEAFQGLDWWISRGGFLPAQWQRHTTVPCICLYVHGDNPKCSLHVAAAGGA